MMTSLHNLKLKTQLVLLVSIMVVGFGIAGFLADRAFNKVLVNGEVYENIQAHKDLTADILPPPAYLIESWQVALEMAAIKNVPVQPLVEKSNQLSDQFKKRTQHWIDTQPQFKTILTEGLVPSGDAFISIRDTELIPAVRSGDAKRVDTALAHLKDAYQKHRAIVDELVVLNEKEYNQIEAEVPSQVSASRMTSFGLALLVLSLTLVGLFSVVGRVIKQLGGEASEALSAAQHIADGDFTSNAKSNESTNTNVIGALTLASETLIQIDHEMARMEAEHMQGNVDANIDVSKFKGAYREMAIGINRMVANHIAVMTKTTDCLNGFAKGDFETPLEQFPGKLAIVNEGVEGLRYNISTLITDMRNMADEHTKGNIHIMMDSDKFAGDYRLLAIGVNEMVKEYIDEVGVVMETISQFGDGNFSATIKEFPGEKAIINKNIKKNWW